MCDYAIIIQMKQWASVNHINIFDYQSVGN